MNKIENQEELIERAKSISKETTQMAQKVLGTTFPIKSLTVFSHYQSEFESLTNLLSQMGEPHNYNNGPRVKLFNPIEVNGNHITYLRIRKPDLERPQIGCNDFEVEYAIFKKKYLAKHSNSLTLIKRPEYEMIELKEPNFNALAYVISN